MSRCYLVLWVLAVLLKGAPLPAQGVATEAVARDSILRNGGFEEGGAVPDAWSRHPKEDPGNVQTRDTQVRHGGAASGLLHSTRPVPAGVSPIQFSQYGVPVRGGETLIALFSTRVEGCRPGWAGIHAYAADGSHLGFTRIDGPAEATDWTPVRQAVSLPKDARKIGFVLYANPNGKTWYDDVALLSTPRVDAMRAAPRIDGRLDEECWAEPRAISLFFTPAGERASTGQTRAWCAYDDQCFSIAFRCPVAPGEPRDREESVQVFLAPNARDGGYAHVTVNRRGEIRDAWGRDASRRSGARAAVAHEAGAWTAEISIPYDRLGITLDTGTEWGLNLVHGDRARSEGATWSIEGSHQPGRFGVVSLQPDLARFCRGDLAARVREAQKRVGSLRTDLSKAGKMGSPVSQAAGRLAECEGRIRALDEVARASGPLAPGKWEEIRAESAALSRRLDEAGEVIRGALFERDPASEGFRVAVAGSLQKIPRDRPVRSRTMLERVRLLAARDEAESFQLVVIPNRGALHGVTVDAPPLRGPGGTIPLTWYRVGYVETGKPSYAVEYVGWWPDPLLPAGAFDVAEGERQPLWLTASVPPDAPAGTYTGEVILRCAGQVSRVPVELKVWGFRIPRPGTLATPFGLYTQPLSDWYYGKKGYREAFTPEQYARWLEFLGRYRLGPKNVAQEFIDIVPEGDGLRANLDALRTTVAPFERTLFPPYSLSLYRLPTTPAVRTPSAMKETETWARRTAAVARAWDSSGRGRQVHIYGIDEPQPEDYPVLVETYRKVKAAVPGYPIMQTIGDPNPKALVGLVDIWCPLSPQVDQPFYAERRRAGETLWTYVCCAPKPPYANFFVDEPATDHRILFWQAWQHGATGLLYWSVGWWYGIPGPPSGKPCFPEVPMRFGEDLGTYKEFKANGDGLLLYPGPGFTPWPSLRLEVIRDGIEDYECLALLRDLARRAKQQPAGRRPAPRTLARAEALCAVPPALSRSLTDYTRDPEAILERRRQIGEAILELNQVLEQPGGSVPTRSTSGKRKR